MEYQSVVGLKFVCSFCLKEEGTCAHTEIFINIGKRLQPAHIVVLDNAGNIYDGIVFTH